MTIVGTVTAQLEATVDLVVLGPISRQTIHVLVDTGFTGWLTLPPTLIASLALPIRRRGRGVLADGNELLFDVCDATIVWDGQPRRIPVYVTGGSPLLGQSLLQGYELTMQVIDGGSVRITPLPRL